MKPTEPSRIETSPPAPEPPRVLDGFPRFAFAICAIKLKLEHAKNLVLLTACIFLLAALKTGARYAHIRFFTEQAMATQQRSRTSEHYALRTAVLASAPSTSSILLGLVLRT